MHRVAEVRGHRLQGPSARVGSVKPARRDDRHRRSLMVHALATRRTPPRPGGPAAGHHADRSDGDRFARSARPRSSSRCSPTGPTWSRAATRWSRSGSRTASGPAGPGHRRQARRHPPLRRTPRRPLRRPGARPRGSGRNVVASHRARRCRPGRIRIVNHRQRRPGLLRAADAALPLPGHGSRRAVQRAGDATTSSTSRPTRPQPELQPYDPAAPAVRRRDHDHRPGRRRCRSSCAASRASRTATATRS